MGRVIRIDVKGCELGRTCARSLEIDSVDCFRSNRQWNEQLSRSHEDLLGRSVGLEDAEVERYGPNGLVFGGLKNGSQ